MTQNRVLILGGTGFLGSRLAKDFASRGSNVSVLSRKPLPFQDFRWLSEQELLNAPHNFQFDLAVNCITQYGRSGESDSELIKANVDTPLKLINELSKANQLKLINVDTALNPRASLYAELKARLRTRLKELKLAQVHLRLDQFYGAGDSASKLITMLFDKMLSQQPDLPLSSGLQIRRFTEVSDVIAAIAAISERLLSPEAEISQVEILAKLGEESSVKDLVLKIKALCVGSRTQLLFGALPDRVAETDAFTVPAEFAFLEKSSFVSLDVGLQRVYEFELQERKML